MDYFELTVDLKTVEPWRDILIAELAETGFESFVETNSGFLGYIPENLYKPEMIEPVLQIESVETYTFKKIEDQNWNAKWEESFDERVNPHGKKYYWLTGYFNNMDEIIMIKSNQIEFLKKEIKHLKCCN